MGRTEIDGDQVQDETLTGDDIQDTSVKAIDVDLPDLATGIVNNPTAIDTINQGSIFGNPYVYRENLSFSTSSVTFQTVIDFNGTLPAGTYRVQYSFTTTNSKENTNNECRVIVNGVEVFLRTQNGLSVNSVGSKNGDIVHAGGAFTGAIEARVSAGNGNALITNAKGDLWRVA